MRRGEIYKVIKPGSNAPNHQRLFVIVSRNILLESNYNSVICAPIYSSYEGLSTQVSLDQKDGMKKSCAIHCDGLISLRKEQLTFFVASLNGYKMQLLNKSLSIAVGIS